ncbi:immunity 63 family protein [Gordonia sp. C13]|uniref:immunity 63 family protein n=1 Tax=Gordonia sp. C13 TaxID=2935078 RepID=UPI00200AEA23|nr:immunity 63 family protein [Gordonia sp. C13]MCK8615419.1 immunity 63 family protein [Gordonia sp. C13]
MADYDDRRRFAPNVLEESLHEVVKRFEAISGRKVRKSELPGESADDPNGFLSVDPGGTFRFEVRERGHPVAETVSENVEDVLYAVMDEIVRAHAGSVALSNPAYESMRDTRRLWFPLWRRWMGELSSDWATRTQEEIQRILESYPFE